ncbi:MAG TPA: translation elongation factor Ts [Thermoanaerobaculia bacterium]|nr:translation elongation factor Ts [Thermoanaerobaculia bacterium]HQR65950.1 translation elongation factor Ts [Thermoanaerobaculia bacterium]
MAITASQVKELRDKTGAGLLDCQNALKETNGSVEEAEKILRKKGLADAAKKAGRVAADGLIGYKVEGGTAALVELNCETDFVAKTDDFRKARQILAEAVFAEAAFGDAPSLDPEKVRALPAPAALPGATGTVADWLKAFTAKTGENTQLRRAARLTAAPGGALTLYAHTGDKNVVVLETAGCDETLAKDLAMQVAALAPQWATREAVPAKAVEEEKEIARAKAAAAGKPANVVEKMVDGMVNKWLGEVVLVDQPFVKDDAKKVSQVVAERAGKDGRVVRFVRLKVGEGVEKKAADLAADVAALTK